MRNSSRSLQAKRAPFMLKWGSCGAVKLAAEFTAANAARPRVIGGQSGRNFSAKRSGTAENIRLLHNGGGFIFI